jgi:hypothetical protein
MLTPQQLKIQKKWKKTSVQISSQLRDIIHGYIMSDGFVDKNGRLQVEQSQQQAQFVMWLYEKMKLIRTNHPISLVTRIRANKKTFSQRFFTQSFLKGFRSMWYKSYLDEDGNMKTCKRLPKSLHCFFNPIFLSLWFAGDGTKLIGQKGAKLEVTAFTEQERATLKKLFLQKFQISVKIQRAGHSKSGTQQWTIVIGSDQYDRFLKLITQIDLIVKCFPSKLHPIITSTSSLPGPNH